MREAVLVEDMPELALKVLVLGVTNLHHAILDAEGVAKVLARLVTLDLHGPAIEVLAVKERNPLVLFLFLFVY